MLGQRRTNMLGQRKTKYNILAQRRMRTYYLFMTAAIQIYVHSAFYLQNIDNDSLIE